jgi:hypothetical protein
MVPRGRGFIDHSPTDHVRALDAHGQPRHVNRGACMENSNAIPPPVGSVSGPGDPHGGRVGPALPDRTVPIAIKARSSGWTSSRSWIRMTALLTARLGLLNCTKAALVDRRLIGRFYQFTAAPASCPSAVRQAERLLSEIAAYASPPLCTALNYAQFAIRPACLSSEGGHDVELVAVHGFVRPRQALAVALL